MAKAFLMQENSKLRTVFIPNGLLAMSGPEWLNSLSATDAPEGKSVILSVSEAQKLQLGQTYASVRQITEACNAIYRTDFTMVTPKPDWYDGLNGKFMAVKRLAREWLDNYSIAVTATIPNSIINFVPTFNASANVIQEITDRTPGLLTPSDLATARDVLARLVGKADSIAKDVEIFAKLEHGVPTGKLVTWQRDMRDAGGELKSGTDTIQQAAASMAEQIHEYKGKVEMLKNEIKEYNKLVALGAGLIGVGAFVALVGGVICLGFPVVGGIVMVLGIGMVIGGSVALGYYLSKINDLSREVVAYNAKISANNRSIVALNTLSGGVTQAISNACNAVKNIGVFSISWNVFSGSLRATISALDEGGQEAKGALVNMCMSEAKEHWADVKEYAKGLLNTPPEVQKVPAGQIAA